MVIDCSNYFLGVPTKETESLSLPYKEPLEQENTNNSRISLTLTKSTRNDTYVSTAPNQQLHSEKHEEVEVETLDGIFQQRRKGNSEKPVNWSTNRQSKKPKLSKSKYIPLDQRIRTLSDIQDLDTTINREFENKVQEWIQDIQIQFKVVEELCD